MKKALHFSKSLPLLILVALSQVSCESDQEKKGAVFSEITGRILVRPGEVDSRARLQTSSGSLYQLTGKQEAILRGFYAGWLVRLNGRVLEDADGEEEGAYEVREILETWEHE